AVAAGLKTMELLRREGTYEKLEAIGKTLQEMLESAAQEAGVACTVQRVGAMLTPFFRDGEVTRWEHADACDRDAFGRFHGALLEGGVYWPPSQFEAGFPSLAHDDAALDTTRQALPKAFAAARGR
ncbi:MAG: aspartate aminotransferase family protein, partial [Myxococcota bacterium]